MAGIGSTPALIVGTAVGGAAAAAFQPALEIPRQEAWDSNRVRILDVGLLARLVAQGGVDLSDAHAEAHRDGYADDKLDALVYLAQTVPGVGEALDLWRKGLMSDALFSHVLVKTGLDQRYAAPILNSKLAEMVGLGDIAYAVVRGILPAPSWVPVAPPTSGDKVPRFPVVDIDPLALAEKLGFDESMLRLMVGRSGLSMAPGMAAQAFFRNIIGPNDYLLAIAEGDLRTEWADAVQEVSRQIPTAGEGVQYQLRGFTDRAGRLDLTRLHGMSDAHSDVLYNIAGRAPAVHAITTGLARGAQYPGDYSMVPEPYRAAIQRSDIRPEFADIVYHDRYTYPSGFQIRAETQNGTLSQPQAEQILLEVGWKPQWATFFSTAWAGGTAGSSTTADKHVAKAQTQVWTATHKAYEDALISDATATTALQASGVDAAAVPAVLQLWQVERDLVRKSLSAAQIKKAWREQIPDPALGRPWTEDEAVARLRELGYTDDDARILLVE